MSNTQEMTSRHRIESKLTLLIESFKSVLYRNDDQFMENLGRLSIGAQDSNKFKYWEWTQGVGLYGFWRLYDHTKQSGLLEFLIEYFNERIMEGLPSKNINTIAPLLTLAHVYELTGDQRYIDICTEWADWIISDLPRTRSGGFQHITSDSVNDQELWDDTLFMTVLFLAKMGQLINSQTYLDEAKYQFLTHIKYLTDTKTGLWYHGWTFNGNHNFARALWGRGNCWITLAIPIMLEIVPHDTAFRRFLQETLLRQVESLEQFQEPDGMWHTIIDDPTSYVESSATAGFGAGILTAIRMGLIPEGYRETADRALQAILELIDDAGILRQSSYGTPMGRTTKSFYNEIPIQSMPYSQALGMLFLIQAVQECESEKIRI